MKYRAALLIIDFFNPQSFRGMGRIGAPALRAARQTAALKARLRRREIVTIYVNDNFGHWDAEFSALVRTCSRLEGAAGAIAQLLAPLPGEASVLKPRHSAFYGTPLEFLLAELRVRALILTGVAADSCITITAHDAHVREFSLWIPKDCVASASPRRTTAALAHLQRVTNATTSASSGNRWPR